MDLGPKIHHLKIVKEALRQQSLEVELQRIINYKNNISQLIQSYVHLVDKRLKENINCIKTLSETEKKMQIYFFQKEIEYIRATYRALILLEKYKRSEPGYLYGEK